MSRAILIIMDSFGIGGAPDAAAYGDEGSNTLGHIAEACARGQADRSGLRSGPLQLPHLDALGLGAAAHLASGTLPPGLPGAPGSGAWGCAQEVSKGKDTPSGHWEIAGVPVPFEWGYFPTTVPTFPQPLVDAMIEQAELPGILGNCHASGTEIIAKLGEEHIQTGKPICYTSADSVFQIAAHEDHFGLDRLLRLCESVRKLVDPLNIGRVIARPFVGETANTFERTGNRRDYAVPPPAPTLLETAISNGRNVLAVGKVADIFAHRGIGDSRKASGNAAIHNATLQALDDARPGDLVVSNYVDFDTLYGHRRDIAGYAAALEAFDRQLPQLLAKLVDGDLLVITADHGCDPSWPGTEHTRERVPVLCAGPGTDSTSIGIRNSFSDIGQSINRHLKLRGQIAGTSFLS